MANPRARQEFLLPMDLCYLGFGRNQYHRGVLMFATLLFLPRLCFTAIRNNGCHTSLVTLL